MGKEPVDCRAGTNQASSRSRTVSDFRSLLSRTVAGAEGRSHTRRRRGAGVPRQTSRWALAQKRGREAGARSVVTSRPGNRESIHGEQSLDPSGGASVLASPRRQSLVSLNRSRRRESALILCLVSKQVRRLTSAATRFMGRENTGLVKTWIQRSRLHNQRSQNEQRKLFQLTTGD